ncbi:MAG: hypothetical protein HOE75_07125 [Chloroflexi bacterium]|jgi:hypothetical protein|nr:hypothetical protein [Chloroflexota bacterium]MBT4073439.1 hypothetical protein [Chloroflexota bacterium]MBT5319605.1 hypothetical protein [Chloroflexota bacterium]MBT6681442.1 hypothetical protein [Chloroflexota bacterium]
MGTTYNVLILGASYGSLLGAKMALAGHNVKLVCLPEEADLINTEGARVRMAARGVDGLVELDTSRMPGKVTAAGPNDVDPSDYDLIGLAMQEPQYGVPVLHDLLDRIAAAKVPCMSIMNMPPLTYLKRIAAIDAEAIKSSYTDASVWDNLDPALMTLCSPDPQAFRPPTEKVNVLQVGLPTNFKAARFDSDAHTAILHQLEADIQAVRFNHEGNDVELPVKLRVHDSVFVPLAKWAMLIAGNYRCVQKDEMRPIKEAVHSNLDESRAAYEWVVELCVKMGADAGDLVPFDKYANAALSLVNPSSAARALAGGAPNIERVDKLVQTVAAGNGMQLDSLDQTVELVDGWLEKNRA